VETPALIRVEAYVWKGGGERPTETGLLYKKGVGCRTTWGEEIGKKRKGVMLNSFRFAKFDAERGARKSSGGGGLQNGGKKKTGLESSEKAREREHSFSGGNHSVLCC